MTGLALKKIPTFVISLPHSLERRQSMHEKLTALSMEFDFFDAIDGRNDMFHSWYGRFNDKKTQSVFT